MATLSPSCSIRTCEELRRLIEEARSVRFSEADAEEQLRSFAFGNLRLEDDRVTRAQIDEAAERIRHQR